MTSIAVFGGTFDPIHSAHLTVAREAANRFALDKILFVPAGRPPHKSGSTEASFEQRYRMIELACRDEPRFEVSRLEEGEGESYTVFTVEKVRAGCGPGDRLYFLIGADAFAEIGSWYRWRDMVAAVEFIVVTRPGHDYEVPEGTRVHRLDTVTLPVSSSEVREKLAAGADVPELPRAVLSYIREQGLYR